MASPLHDTSQHVQKFVNINNRSYKKMKVVKELADDVHVLGARREGYRRPAPHQDPRGSKLEAVSTRPPPHPTAVFFMRPTYPPVRPSAAARPSFKECHCNTRKLWAALKGEDPTLTMETFMQKLDAGAWGREAIYDMTQQTPKKKKGEPSRAKANGQLFSPRVIFVLRSVTNHRHQHAHTSSPPPPPPPPPTPPPPPPPGDDLVRRLRVCPVVAAEHKYFVDIDIDSTGTPRLSTTASFTRCSRSLMKHSEKPRP